MFRELYRQQLPAVQLAFWLWVSFAIAATIAGAITGSMQSAEHPGLMALVGGLTGYATTGALGSILLGYQASRSGSGPSSGASR